MRKKRALQAGRPPGSDGKLFATRSDAKALIRRFPCHVPNTPAMTDAVLRALDLLTLHDSHDPTYEVLRMLRSYAHYAARCNFPRPIDWLNAQVAVRIGASHVELTLPSLSVTRLRPGGQTDI